MSERLDLRDLRAVVLLSGVADQAFGSYDTRFATAVASDRGFCTTILVALLPLLVGVRARVSPASTPTTTTSSAARGNKTPLFLQPGSLSKQFLTSFCMLVRFMRHSAIGSKIHRTPMRFTYGLHVLMNGRFGGRVCYFSMGGIFGVGALYDG